MCVGRETGGRERVKETGRRAPGKQKESLARRRWGGGAVEHGREKGESVESNHA